jgi:hypothetical protein
MADSRPGGIEKIAHLFIAGSGAASLRARENSPLRWTGPAAGAAKENCPGLSGGQSGADTRAPGPVQAPPAAASADGTQDRPHDTLDIPTPESSRTDAMEGPAGVAAYPGQGAAVPSAPQLLLSRAKVSAVLSGHMGPLAGPAAELFAKTLAREGTSVGMLYGPAEFACLHRFAPDDGDRNNGNQDNKAAAQGSAYRGGDEGAGLPPGGTACDMLLLPDWVFQSDLWPISRGVHSICLGYGAGSEGLMSAYGALKGLISRLGKPEEIFLLPFGCTEQEETWTHERLADMCRRFLDTEPRVARERPDVRVHVGELLPIEGGAEGVRQLFAAIGQPHLTLVPRSRQGETELGEGPMAKTEQPAMVDQQPQGADLSADVLPLVLVPAVPADGEAVLRALIEFRQADSGGFFDLWSRNGVAGTILGREGLIGAAGEIRDLLGFALWMCRQARIGDLDELTTITIAARRPEDWLLEAARAMPVPVRWVTWRTFRLGDQLGVSFE